MNALTIIRLTVAKFGDLDARTIARARSRGMSDDEIAHTAGQMLMADAMRRAELRRMSDSLMRDFDATIAALVAA